MLSKTFVRAFSSAVLGTLLIGAGTATASAIGPTDVPVDDAGASFTRGAYNASADQQSTTVPRHVSRNGDLQLLGVTESGIAVRQSTDRLLSGAPGTKLKLHGSFARTEAVLVGDHLTWSVGKVLHRVAIGSGVDEPLATEVTPLSATPDGYLGLAGQTLTRYVTGSASMPLLTGVTKVSAIGVDADEVLVGYTDPVRKASALALVPLAGGPRTWSRTTSSPVRRLAFSDTLIGWVSRPNGTPVVETQPRVGGTKVSVSGAPARLADSAEFAVAGDRAAWPADVDGINVLSGTKRTYQEFGGVYYWGLYGYNGNFYIATSGSYQGAGIYRSVGSGGRWDFDATVPRQPSLINSYSLTADTLRYNDDTYASTSQRIWQQSVTGTGSPLLSKETTLAPTTRAWSPIWFSAGRGTTVGPADSGVYANRLRLVDRGHLAGMLPKGTAFLPFKMSGPYVQVGTKVYGSNRKLALDLTKLKPTSYDLYGANVVYARSNGQIWWRDLTRKASKNNPRLLTDTCSGTCDPSVRIWGTQIAYLTKNNNIVVRTLTDPTARLVKPGVTADELQQLSLREGTLIWSSSTAADGFRRSVLDLRSAASTPVALTLTNEIVDGHLGAGLDPTGNLVIERLPFGGAQKPRLIGTVAVTGFSPNGDGHADTFRPAFDTTKPLTKVKLTIRSGSRVIRTLIGTGPDGSIRNLSWNGRTGSGTKTRAGTYSWSLTAVAADGEGPLVGVNGTGAVKGTIKLTR